MYITSIPRVCEVIWNIYFGREYRVTEPREKFVKSNFSCDISCGKNYDLSPYAVENAVTSTYVTTSVPSSDQFELTPNKKVYIQFDLPKITKTKEVAFVKSNKWPCHSVFYIFIRPDNCYPNLKRS